MNKSPLISVVIPTYNRAVDLERALKSVQAQTFTDWEIIIVDNHSVDNTDKVVVNFNDPRIKLFNIHNNSVIAASPNVWIYEAFGLLLQEFIFLKCIQMFIYMQKDACFF